MTSRQLQDLTPQELADHAHEIKDAAREALELLVTNAAAAADKRAEAIAKLDILHRQQMMGEWSMDINEATKQEVKKHMGSMLGDWGKAGKLSKRRIKKNIRKTKRRRQKITKRRRRK
jgi:hypothetical protein